MCISKGIAEHLFYLTSTEKSTETIHPETEIAE